MEHRASHHSRHYADAHADTDTQTHLHAYAYTTTNLVVGDSADGVD